MTPRCHVTDDGFRSCPSDGDEKVDAVGPARRLKLTVANVIVSNALTRPPTAAAVMHR